MIFKNRCVILLGRVFNFYMTGVIQQGIVSYLLPVVITLLLPKAEVCGKPGGQKTKAVLLGSGLSI